MYISSEKQTILYRVDRPIFARESNPASEVMVDPILFVRQREDMRGFEPIPQSMVSPGIHCFRYDATLISLAYLVPKLAQSCSRTEGFGPGDDDLVGHIDGTISDNKIVTREEWLRISWDFLAVIVLKEIGTRNDENNVNHRVEIGVGKARAQNQAPKLGKQVSEIVKEDIATDCPYPGAWHFVGGEMVIEKKSGPLGQNMGWW